ncbi:MULTISPECIES: glycosyltransferase [Rhodococcus]|nr:MULTISPECIES: glycosyltransferase [Rhodococcus]
MTLTAKHASLNEMNSYSMRLPSLSDRQRWWETSKNSYRRPRADSGRIPALVWNPFVAVSNVADIVFNGQRMVHLDLLDDWTHHFAFGAIKKEVEAAYAAAFESATYVTANSEGTAALARRFGRSDVTMILNGVDPQRFSTISAAKGPITVGYVGKIGRRLDLELIQQAARQLPNFQFVMAGPVLDAEYKTGLEFIPNVKLIGDVHYDEMPSLLQTFDIGWVPHRVGEGEVGGDVIKTYEYRAAGLPVLSTPVAGAGSRGLGSVTVLAAEKHIAFLDAELAGRTRVARIPERIAAEMRWGTKTLDVLNPLFDRALVNYDRLTDDHV